jgi:calreticulin
VVHPDNTFEAYMDDVELAKGRIEDYYDILPPKEIKDPNAKKPADWEENEFVDDPNDTKPDGYDDIPELIPDESET